MSSKNRKGRTKNNFGPFVPLPHFMLDSAAWKSLRPPNQSTYIAIARLYNGTNNGRLAISNRMLAERITYSRATAKRSVDELVEKGFIEIVTAGSFGCKRKFATEYRLTILMCDVTKDLPSKAFMKWKPKFKTRRHLVASTASPESHQSSPTK
jgi:hypothetical protein